MHGSSCITTLASKKGIVITAIIAAGIVGASTLIWLLPQQQGRSSGINITDREGAEADAANLPADNLSFVYTQHNFAITAVENSFDKWTKGDVSTSDVNSAMSKARSDLDALKKRVDTPGIPQPWQQSYGLYSQALDKFGSYLDEMKKIVDSGDKGADHSALDSIKGDMSGLIDRSIKAFPTTANSTNTTNNATAAT